MFRRILVANRGEIAARIQRACEALGIETVVVHSDADRGAPWLESATQTVCVGPGRPADSYLNASAVLQAAEQTDCQALHPGYGFLAESGVFAARCEQQGLTVQCAAAGQTQMGYAAAAEILNRGLNATLHYLKHRTHLLQKSLCQRVTAGKGS